MGNNDINHQMQELIRSFDVYNKTIQTGIIDALNQGADIIMEEQRRLVPEPTDPRAKRKLRGLVGKYPLRVTKKGLYQISTGYTSSALRVAPEAIWTEFGRRAGRDKNGKKVGAIAEKNHIRKGFDNKAEEAVRFSADLLEEAAKKWASAK